MTDNEMRRSMAVGVTVAFVILLATLNMLAPVFGSIFILIVGILWTSVIRVIYGEE